MGRREQRESESIRPSRRRLLAVFAMAVGIALAAPASSQPIESENRAAARALGKEGIALYQQGEYVEALDRLSRAHAVVGLTTTGLWRARCLVALGRLVEAAEQYLEVSRMKLDASARAVHRKAVQDARRERKVLLARIPKVRLQPRGEVSSLAIIRIDGKLVPPALLGVARPIDPGDHMLVVEQGERQQKHPFAVGEGESIDLPFDAGPSSAEPAPATTGQGTAAPEPPAPPQPPTEEPASGPGAQAISGWVAVGLGGAGLVLGAVTGGLALDRQGTLDEGCVDGDCPPPLHGDVDSFETFRTLSAVGLIAGGVLALGGLTVVLTAPAAEPTPDVAASAALRFGIGRARLDVPF